MAILPRVWDNAGRPRVGLVVVHTIRLVIESPDFAMPRRNDRTPLRAARAPTGDQIELANGDQRVVVVEVGAGLRSYSAAGLDLLDGYPADQMSPSGRGQMLIPWPNRVKDGTYEFLGHHYQLALTEPARGNAIHGLVRWVPWAVVEREASRAVLGLALHPHPGYPFSLELTIEYTVSMTGLRVRTTATNVGPNPCPFGSGAHPYLCVGTSIVDQVIMRAPGRTVLRSDARGIPVGSGPVGGTEYDFGAPRPIGPTKLDHAFTDLERDEQGLACVELSNPNGDTGLTLWADDSYRYLMLFSGDPLPDVNRRSLAVEPMTCAPNAFQSKDGLIVLEPGRSFTGTWGIRPH